MKFQANFCQKTQLNKDKTQIFGKVCHRGQMNHLKIIKATEKLDKFLRNRLKPKTL